MLKIEDLKFDQNGLIPAIVQDFRTKKVLMVAYMNRESLEISLKEKRTCFFSRSRKTLWRKGETSGNVQHIVAIIADCDRDSLLVDVKAEGPACHLGTESCFCDYLFQNDELKQFSIGNLYAMLQGRKEDKVEDSYTSYLFEKGLDKILKKVGEECTEVVIAGKGGDNRELAFEIADLTYHILVLMIEKGIAPSDILDELAKRHIVDHKVKQETMQ